MELLTLQPDDQKDGISPEVEDLLNSIADIGGIQGLIRRQFVADAIIEGLALAMPRLAARAVYNYLVVPAVEITIEAAKKTANKSMSRLFRKIVNMVISADWIKNKLPIICRQIEGAQGANKPNQQSEFLIQNSQKDLEELHEWIGKNSTALGEAVTEVQATLDALCLELEKNNKAKLTAFPAWDMTCDNDVLLATSRGIGFVGRENELNQLQKFLDDPAPFAWWAVSAPGGAGKTRLLLHFIENFCGGWFAG